jgi:acyl carrier protein
MAVEPSERQKFLEGHIREQLARVLGTSPAKVDVDKPLISLGLDSLMAVEIGNRMQSELGVSIPPVKFMEGLTTAGMAQYLVEQLSSDRAAAPAASLRDLKPGLMAVRGGEEPLHAPPPDVDKVLVAVNSLSDREVDTLLKRIEMEETISEEEEEAV